MGVAIEDSYHAASDQDVDHYVICGVVQMRRNMLTFLGFYKQC
jgi:hypothetical protein